MKELDSIVHAIQNRDYDAITQFIQEEEVYQNVYGRTFLEELIPKVCWCEVGSETSYIPFNSNN